MCHRCDHDVDRYWISHVDGQLRPINKCSQLRREVPGKVYGRFVRLTDSFTKVPGDDIILGLFFYKNLQNNNFNELLTLYTPTHT